MKPHLFYNYLKSFFLIFIIFSFLIIDNFSQQASNDKKVLTFEKLYQQFINLSEGSLRSANVDSLIFTKQDAVFSLNTGVIYECPPINNETHAMLFMGNGNFKFTPPSIIEQMQLYRFYEKKSLDENFEFIFLLFTDSTANEIERQLTFTDTEPTWEYKSKLEEAAKYIFDEGKGIDETIAYIFMEGLDGNFFYSHFNDSNGSPMFYKIDPTDEEEISLMKRYEKRFTNIHESVCQYTSGKKNYRDRSRGIKNGKIYISQYMIDSKIEDNLDFSAHAKLNFIPSFNNQNWMLLYLYSGLEVDSILWDGKRKAKFFKGEESFSLWVLFDETFKEDISYTLDIYYHGELLEKNELGWISIKSPDYWFPRCTGRDKSKFDLTFHTPSKYKFCSVGKLVLHEEEDDVITTKWQSDSPIRNASFNIGSFDEYKLEMKDMPVVTSYITEYGHNQIANILAQEGELSGSDMEEKIAADVVNSFNLFKTAYGDIPIKEIYVTEIPYSHGEAFPGLIHLSWVAFQGLGKEGMLEQFVAHEVAHQWWGIQVDFESYHDQWLSEGFAEYSGLWYMQLVIKDNKKFFDELDNWKEQILNNRKFLFGSGQEAGPISLGYRTHSSETAGDYQLIIYKKGAWVLHMLRNMMLDLNAMKEDKFENMMKDFFNTYKGKKASTRDFQKIVEKHFGMDMSWFFNQWIYDTNIPDYKFAYNTTKTPDGKYKVRCRVSQTNVPPEFKMYINMLVKFEDDKYARVRKEINGLQSEFDLPLMPMEPKGIIFNDLHSVLCNVDYEEW